MRTRYKLGRPVRIWQPKRDGDPVEALDCRVYAYAALVGLERQRRLNLKEASETLRAIPLKDQAQDYELSQPVRRVGTRRRIKSSYMQ